jgi:hypothetical protein
MIAAFATGPGRRLGRLQPVWAMRPEKGAAQPREEVRRAAICIRPNWEEKPVATVVGQRVFTRLPRKGMRQPSGGGKGHRFCHRPREEVGPITFTWG